MDLSFDEPFNKFYLGVSVLCTLLTVPPIPPRGDATIPCPFVMCCIACRHTRSGGASQRSHWIALNAQNSPTNWRLVQPSVPVRDTENNWPERCCPHRAFWLYNFTLHILHNLPSLSPPHSGCEHTSELICSSDFNSRCLCFCFYLLVFVYVSWLPTSPCKTGSSYKNTNWKKSPSHGCNIFVRMQVWVYKQRSVWFCGMIHLEDILGSMILRPPLD